MMLWFASLQITETGIFSRVDRIAKHSFFLKETGRHFEYAGMTCRVLICRHEFSRITVQKRKWLCSCSFMSQDFLGAELSSAVTAVMCMLLAMYHIFVCD